MRELFDIFWSFLKIGAFTFGGGYAMIPLIQHEVIHNRGWLAERDFIDLLTLAQAAPGPIALNTAVFVGYRRCGYVGSLAAVLGVVVPSFVIILIVAMFFANMRHNAWVDAAFKGMRPAVVALIVAPIMGLTRGLRPWLLAVSAAVALVVWYWGVSPVWFLVAGAAVGILHAARQGKEVNR